MKTGKKLLALWLAMLSIILAASGCGSEQAADSLTYTLSADGSCYEVSEERQNNLNTVSITIPETYDGKPVVIKSRAFYGLPELETVMIEGASGDPEVYGRYLRKGKNDSIITRSF